MNGSMRVHVCIPHFFREHSDQDKNPNGYGSQRAGAKLERSIALARTITALLNLQRNKAITSLNHHHKTIDYQLQSEDDTNLEIKISIYTDGINQLTDTLDIYKHRLEVYPIETTDPTQIPLICRDNLINNEQDYDLLCYLEDDIVIHDKLFFDKQSWFLEKTNHQCSLMPHRYERIDRGEIECLLIDGMLTPSFNGSFPEPKENAAFGTFRGTNNISFDLANNPHSGTFTLSRKQAQLLQKEKLPYKGLIGP